MILPKMLTNESNVMLVVMHIFAQFFCIYKISPFVQTRNNGGNISHVQPIFLVY